MYVYEDHSETPCAYRTVIQMLGIVPSSSDNKKVTKTGFELSPQN
jgi:hypothetical protein